MDLIIDGATKDVLFLCLYLLKMTQLEGSLGSVNLVIRLTVKYVRATSELA